MTTYFDAEQSIHYRCVDDVNHIISIIANRYLGQNPPLPFVFRVFNYEGILSNPDGRANMNLAEKFKAAKSGQLAYVYAKFWAENDRVSDFSLSCYGPTRIYLNGNLLLRSSVQEDVNSNHQKLVAAPIKKGWNTFFIKCVKTASGFGCIFGPERAKWDPLNLLAPFAGRGGQAGWVYSEPLDKDLLGEGNIPDPDADETDTGIRWYPEMSWGDSERAVSPLTRIFGEETNCAALAWSKLVIPVYGVNKCLIQGETEGPVDIWIDGKSVFSSPKAEKLNIPVDLQYGSHDLLVNCVSVAKGHWGFSIKAAVNDVACSLSLPYPVKGTDDVWLYLGPFDPDSQSDAASFQTMEQLFQGKEGATYWRVDAPGAFVRPFLEAERFGRWNYPLGVTLYGLLQAGRILKRPDITDYVTRHIAVCVKMHEYACWDRNRYGYSGINNQLVELDMLDDCGSFGSTMLEAYPECGDPAILAVAEIIADHMANRQERLPDGAFYRICKGLWLENTMWVDDLYMSTPFLARYARISGKTEYFADAAQQFFLFKKYLYMPEYQVMSHVYDFKHHTPTYIPWGRGNGWALFSLSEILALLPEDDQAQSGLVAFFNELCEGYAALQDEDGLWRQVLTRPDSYQESSCTAMFAYAFARGVRYGWINEERRAKYINAAFKAWEGLTKKAIDKDGNVHGVCRGSAYSFTPEYYMEELLWVTNDTHGIGIVMLAGIEISNLTRWLKEEA